MNRATSISTKWCATQRISSLLLAAFGAKDYCTIQRICVLRGALRDATEAFLAVLDTYTLADLIKPHKALSSLLLDVTPRCGPPSKEVTVNVANREPILLS
jgi:hypothetical protein